MNLWWLVVFLCVFLIGVTKSGFGAGAGLMVVPITAIAMGHIPDRGAEAALGLLLPLLIMGDFIALWQYRHFFSFRRASNTDPNNASPDNIAPNTPAPPASSSSPADTASHTSNPPSTDTHRPGALTYIRKLLLGTAVGVIIGGLMLWWFHQQAGIVGALIKIEIGFECIGLVGLHWWRKHKGVQQHIYREPWRGRTTGAFAGISSTLAHASGPIIAMYLLPLKLDRRLYVGTSAIYFFMLNTAKLPAYYLSGQFQHASIGFTLQFTPLLVFGALFGVWVNRRLSDKFFSQLIYLITFLLGWYILYDGVRGLL